MTKEERAKAKAEKEAKAKAEKEAKGNIPDAKPDVSNWEGKKVYTPFGAYPVVEDLGDKVTVEYGDKSRKIFSKAEIKLV